MRNKIACSAQLLSQLEPDMVQSVVGNHVFKLGKQYLSESRVRILDSNETQITSEVAGTYGVYTQNIRLKGGILSTKCSCPASEQPFCRHCVAVLLEFYQNRSLAKPMDVEVTHELVSPVSPEETKPAPPSEPASAPPSPFELKFHEVSLFIDWVQGTVAAINSGTDMPRIPDLGPGQVKTWVEAIQNLREQYQRSEEARTSTVKELKDSQRQIVTVTQNLERMTQEAKEAKVTCASLRRELEDSQEMLDKYSEVAKERDRYVDQLNAVRGELLRKGAELDSLIASLKQVSVGLQAVTPQAR